ncbi:MAG: UvrB/UvrC motif-containing protein [Planctomycetota bacterium]|jgi:protein arginine kinase activator
MGKLCQCCNQREAKIHFTELKDGKKTEMHLCEGCAQDKNMMLAFPSLLSTLVKGGSGGLAGESEAVPSVCPRCGIAYSEFKSKGRIGCPACYDAFAPVLIPLLEKVHSASAHTGKHPPHEADPDASVPEPSTPLPAAASEPSAPEPVDEASRLQAELEAAIVAEDYELAAELRDRIRALAASDEGDGEEDSIEL